jgi:hypothetical protein
MHYDPKSSETPRHAGHDAHPGQGDLFAQPVDEPAPVHVPAPRTSPEQTRKPKQTRTEAFLEFHQDNPDVWTTLLRLSREWLAAGTGRCSITLLISYIRWETTMRMVGDGQFELNDHHASFYVRALMHFHPELDGMFELRSAPEADAWIAQYKGQAAA